MPVIKKDAGSITNKEMIDMFDDAMKLRELSEVSDSAHLSTAYAVRSIAASNLIVANLMLRQENR
jgi:hypothetical protein